MLYFANEDYKLKCADSTKVDVSLENVTPVCFTPLKSADTKINGKSILLGLTITVTAATGSITTSIIDGSNIVFVSAAGTLTGSSEKVKDNSAGICLADENATILTLESSKCTKGKLTVVGTNSSSGATVTDICDIWFSNAGQNYVKGD